MKKTNIEWTDETDNIIVVKGGGWWCRKISPGCANCYAAKLNQSAFFGGNKLAYSGKTPELELRRDIIQSWARQRIPRKHFVASMTDVFGDWVSQEWANEFLDGATAAQRQTFQFLTKRPDVAYQRTEAWLEARSMEILPQNIQMMTSIENQEEAERRIPWLLKIRCHVRGLSCEPLLSEVLIDKFLWRLPEPICDGCPKDADCECGFKTAKENGLPSIDWVICGGESGPHARPMETVWAESLHQQCSAAGVAFFMKQMGGVQNKRGAIEDLPENMRVRDFPNV